VEIQVNNLTDVSREVEITATAEELRPHFEKKYAEMRPKLDVKGFRKGKAPLDIVKKLYGEMIEQDSLQDVATDLYRQTIKEKNLKPIGDPTLVDMDYRRGEHLRVKIRYDIRPSIVLKNYKGIKVQRPIHTVTELEVERELLRLRRMNATFEPATVVQGEEYVVTADLQDLDPSGMPIIGKRSPGVRFYLADEQQEQPFKNALKSAETGGEYRVTFEHEHGDHKHAVNTKVMVKKIEKVVLPAFDNVFVTNITKEKVATTEEFLANLRKDLAEYWKSRADRYVLNALTGELLKMHDFLVPDSLTRAVVEGLLKEMAEEYPKKQLPDDFDYDKFWQENRSYAEAQAKWALLREEIVKAEAITVEDADFALLAGAEAEKINIDKDRLLQYYKSSDQVRERLASDKLMTRLLSLTKVEEVEESTLSTVAKG